MHFNILESYVRTSSYTAYNEVYYNIKLYTSLLLTALLNGIIYCKKNLTVFKIHKRFNLK